MPSTGISPRHVTSNRSGSVARANTTACIRCRQKKKRCDQKLPRCRLCELAGVECFGYDAVARRQVPRSYIHSLEERVAYLELKLREHDVEYDDLATPGQDDPSASQQATTAPITEHARTSEREASQVGSILGVSLRNQVESGAASREAIPPITMPVDPEREASFSKILMAELMRPRLAPQLQPSRLSGQNTPHDHSGITNDLETRPISLPTRETAENLVKEYFQSTSVGMPLLHEPTFREKLQLIYTLPRVVDVAETHKTPEARIALFFVLEVFSAALLSMSKHDPARVPTWLADRYHKTAVAALTETGLPGGVEGVQALLLVGQYYYLHPTLWVVWNTVGAALRLAVELGLHEDPKPGEIDALALDTRRRTFWVAYSMDRNISVALNMPSCLSDGAINTEFPSVLKDEFITKDGILAEDAHESGAKLVSLHLIRYRQIQSEMQRALYERPAPPYAPIEMSGWQSRMHDRIHKWHDTIPSNENMRSFDKAVVETFELTHHTALFRLYRPSPNNPDPSGAQLLLAAQSATKMIHLYRDFFRRKRLTIYWQSVENVFCAGTTLMFAYANSPQTREAIEFQSFQSLISTCSSVLWGMVEHFPAFQGKRDAFDAASSKIMGNMAHVSAGNCASAIPLTGVDDIQAPINSISPNGLLNPDTQAPYMDLTDFDDLSMVWEATSDLGGNFLPSWV